MKKYIKKLLHEALDKTISCEKCGWDWKASESSEKDMYLCHKCGYNNKPRLKENIDIFKQYEQELLSKGFEAEFNTLNDKLVTIEILGIPKELHGQGLGTQIMTKLCSMADEQGVVLQLRPSSSSTHSRAKLIKFYSNFGFVQNIGLNKNNAYQYMYRLPKSNTNLNEEILTEDVSRLNEIPDGFGLYISRNPYVNITLYNPATKQVFGMAALSDDNGVKCIGRIAAEKGFGPLMCEIAMTTVYPNFLMLPRTGDVRPALLSVWKRFLDRSDIKKVTLPIENENYETTILTQSQEIHDPEEKKEYFNSLDDMGKETLFIFNTMYKYKVTDYSKLLELVAVAKNSIKQGQTTKEEVKWASIQYFSEKY